MVSPDVVRSVAGIAGNVISVRLFLLPVPTLRKMIKRKSVGEYSPDTFLIALLNCALWAVYALPSVRPDSMLFLTVNGAGVVIQATYLAIFFVLSPDKQKRLRMLRVLGIGASFVVALVLGVLLGARTHVVRSLTVGSLCVAMSTVMYAAPITVMKRVIQKESVEYIGPFVLSLLGLLNAACWTAYALTKFDLNIAIPNGLGVLFALAQLILYLCYYESTPRKEKKVELPTVRPKPYNTHTVNGGSISIAVEQEKQSRFHR